MINLSTGHQKQPDPNRRSVSEAGISVPPRTALGIDGCRGGWVVAFRVDGEIQFETRVDLPSCNEVLALDASVMIDMPIGLLSEGGTRHCDALARAQLRPYRSSSVFGVPAREVASCTNYAEANALSRKLSGKGLSKQSFYLFPKIRELDGWLVQPGRKGVWHECHPEVAFACLNGGVALKASKKTEEGRAARLRLLRELGNVESALSRGLANYPRKEVLPDDFIDALVCLLTAERAPDRRIVLPQGGPSDDNGLRMEIVAPHF